MLKQITDKNELHYVGDVYDLTIKDQHNYNIDNIVVHNSGGGSLVCYALDIIKIDPLQYDLLFERFLNPERAHIPDIDADFGIYEGYKVFDYLNEKYGKNQCCNIITYQRLKCKSLIKDICRSLEIPIPDTNNITKKIEEDASLQDVLNNKDFRLMLNKYPKLKEFLENYGTKIEGLPRQTGQHAAGICVAPFDVRKITPVVPAKENESNMQTNLSSFEKDNMEALGIIKYDILKLKNLDIIQKTIDLINKGHNLNITADDIPLNDIPTWKALQDGKTLGVFQFEKPIGVKTLKTVKPDNIDELAACNSFIRPGTEGIDAFVKGKAHGGGHKYGDERIDEILANTFGAIVFQEQVMKLIAVLLDISFGKADLYRRALEKPNKGKNKAIVDDFKNNCVNIASKNHFDPQIAEKVKQAIIDNSGYLFNKCIAGSERIYCCDKKYQQPTIEEMYNLKNDIEFVKKQNKQYNKYLHKQYNKRGYGTALSLKEDNTLISHDIRDIVYMGVKEVYEVTTENNCTVRITDNHKFPTPHGEFLLSELNIGDELYTINDKAHNKSRVVCSKIKSILKVGKENVYHIQMKDPYHNLLLSNGIVVSNSHAVAYSIISYQTAYLKTHYPLEFYATNINTCGESEFFNYLQQTKQLGLNITPPDVNISKNECTIYNNSISIGFNVLKGIGSAMANKIIEHQPYDSIQFILDSNLFNKKCIETLINANALENLPITKDSNITLTVPQLKCLMEYYNTSSGKTQRYIVDSRMLPGSFLKQDGIIVENNEIILPETELVKLNLNPDDFTKTSKQGKGRFATVKPKSNGKGLFATNTSTNNLYDIYIQHKNEIDSQEETIVETYLREINTYNFSFSEHPCMGNIDKVNKYNEDKLFEEVEDGKMYLAVGIIIDDVTVKTVKDKFKIYSFSINTPYENINVSMWEDVYKNLNNTPKKGLKCKVQGLKSFGAINVKKASSVLIKA